MHFPISPDSRGNEREQGSLTTLISCTKARPNLTCTFSVIFCTGRMSLLYPLNRSRTNLSSSSEHRPASEAINAINELVRSTESWIPWDKSRKLETRTPPHLVVAHATFLSLSLGCQKILVIPTSERCSFLCGARVFSSIIPSLRKRGLTDAQNRRDQE